MTGLRATQALEGCSWFSVLKDRLVDKSATVGICGLGYVGLPLVSAIGDCGFRVVGFDIDNFKIEQINAGRSYIRHIASGRISALLRAGRLTATSDFSRIRETDVLLICVPTPLNRHREPDLSFVISTSRSIAAHARPGQLIILESTTYPGTTEDVVAPIFVEAGLTPARDLFIAFSPEREDPGNADYDTGTIPKVVGALGTEALELAALFYGCFVKRVVRVSSTNTAEAVKLTENIFRSVNIALVNELKIIYTAMGIDVWEVIDAAKTKPFGFMPFYPGPGVGGHCIPIDPFYLTWKAREFEIATRFIELAGQINSSMPELVVDRLARELDRRFRRALNGSRVLLVGISYKKNVDDMRESPSLRLMELIEARGSIVDYYDPLIAEIPNTREHRHLAGRRSVVFDPPAFSCYDATLIATDHDDVDYHALVAASNLIIDTRNVCTRHNIVSSSIAKA